MAEYIEREAAVRIAEKYGLESGTVRRWYSSAIADMIADDLESLPVADVVPVKHGQWRKPNGGSATPFCSCCWKWAPMTWSGGYTTPPYCPSCGARMDGDDNG